MRKKAIKRKVSRIVSLSMALVLMGSFNPLYVSAQEYDAEGDFETGGIEISLADGYGFGEDFAIGDMGIRVPGSDNLLFDKEITAREFNIERNENIIQLDAGGIWAADAGNGIQTFAADAGADSESTLRCGTVSDYLSETDDYRLYGFNLSAGDYLQVRLSVPLNIDVDYFVPIFDSGFNLLKRSTYPTYSNDMQSVEQSVGYLCTSDEEVIFGAYSLSGGSSTTPFTLEFSITTNFSDINEPNEHAMEAVALSFGISGTTVSGRLNSPVDDDWYSFTVPNDSRYNETRLNLTSTSSLNACKVELYEIDSAVTLCKRNASEIELKLSAGTYYVRVSSANAFSDFYPGDIPAYNLSLVPVSKVDSIKVTELKGPTGSENCTYDEGTFYRLYDEESNWIKVSGTCYSDTQFSVPARNVKINVAVYNMDTESVKYGSAVVDSNGWFHIVVPVDRAGGIRTYENHPTSTLITYHKYDLMSVIVWPGNDESKNVVEHFYLYQRNL